jgi:hypothetical protein
MWHIDDNSFSRRWLKSIVPFLPAILLLLWPLVRSLF